MLAHDASGRASRAHRQVARLASLCRARVVERALRDPRPHEVDIRLREEWPAERHALTADARDALDLLHEIAVVGVARGGTVVGAKIFA